MSGPGSPEKGHCCQRDCRDQFLLERTSSAVAGCVCKAGLRTSTPCLQTSAAGGVYLSSCQTGLPCTELVPIQPSMQPAQSFDTGGWVVQTHFRNPTACNVCLIVQGLACFSADTLFCTMFLCCLWKYFSAVERIFNLIAILSISLWRTKIGINLPGKLTVHSFMTEFPPSSLHRKR